MVRKIIKTALVVLLATVIAVPVLYIISAASIGPVINDGKAEKIADKLSRVYLPPEITLIESDSFCGNTSGTGNHVEIWAGLLLYSDLPEEAVRQFYENELIQHLDYDPMFLAISENLEFNHPTLRHFISFQFLDTVSDGRGYYIVGGFFNPATQHDLRGH